MISQETKDQIETEMLKLYPIKDGRRVSPTGHTIMFDVNIERRVGAIEGATKYAEKLEEKDKVIESKDREIELLTKDIKDQGDYLKEMININVLNDAFNSGEEWRKGHKVKEGEQFTDYFMRVFEVEKEDRDRELAQLKEIAERMVKILKTSDIEDEDEELEDVLMAYAEWCKQNLK